MLRLALLLMGGMAALFLPTACGGPGPTPNIPIDPAATEPVPATPAEPAPMNTSPATATPAPVPTNTPTLPSVTRAASATVTRPAPTARPTATEPPPTPTPPESDPEDVATIRRIVYDYWVALNDYDVDLALTMLEANYRAQEEELIRSDIGQMKLFRVKLEVSEDTPPTINTDGDYETYLTLKTPVDTRRALMVFRNIDGQWWIVFSDEVE